MKKFCYYLALFFLWVIIHVLFGATMLAVGAVKGAFPTHFIALAVAVLIPEYWLISIGLTLFSRDMLANKILGKGKQHSKIIPTALVTLGTIMVIASVSISAIRKTEANEITETRTPRKLEISIDNYTTLHEGSEMGEERSSNSDLLLTKTILDYKAGMNETFENMKEGVPIIIDDIVTLENVLISESAYSIFYQLNIDKDDFPQEELDDIIKEHKEDIKKELYYPTISICNMAGVNPTDFFKTANIKFIYIFSDTNNEHIGLCEIDFKDFAGKQH